MFDDGEHRVVVDAGERRRPALRLYDLVELAAGLEIEERDALRASISGRQVLAVDDDQAVGEAPPVRVGLRHLDRPEAVSPLVELPDVAVVVSNEDRVVRSPAEGGRPVLAEGEVGNNVLRLGV